MYSAQSLSQNNGKVMKIILIVLLCIIGVIAAAFYFTSGLTDAARDQLNTIKAGDIKAAYNMTSKAFQNATSFAEFESLVEKTPVLKNYEDATFTERSVENGTGHLKGSIKATDGSQMLIEYQLVKEDGKWKVQAFKLSAAGAN